MQIREIGCAFDSWFCNCHKSSDMHVSIVESVGVMGPRRGRSERNEKRELPPVPRVRDGNFIRFELLVARGSSLTGVGLGRGTVAV
jgi:hypothetical protein